MSVATELLANIAWDQTTTYAIHDLCDHPEVFELLRQEATTLFESRSYETFDRMPLLESFIMESARTSCSDAGRFLLRYTD